MDVHILVLIGLLGSVFVVVFIIAYYIGTHYQIDLPFIDVMDERGRIIFRKDADGWTGITRRGKTFSYDESDEEEGKVYEEVFTAEGNGPEEEEEELGGD
ncbi:MAG: hypothetical protein ACFFBD_11195 [Candidatus Hodarchaeota archaeon]